MKSKACVLGLLTLIFLCLACAVLYAQEQEEQGNVFTIETFKVRFDKLDEFPGLFA